MKKRDIKTVKFSKQTISKLNMQSTKGGGISLASRPAICDRFTYSCECSRYVC